MNSPLCYIGGKSLLSKIIIDSMPDHHSYVEVFAGAAWVFFKKEKSKVEIINDLDGDLVSFYRVLQNHLEEFIKQFRWLITSREWWNDWNKQMNTTGLTDIQRAARYYYVQRLCFGGKVKGRAFGTAADRPPRINLLRIEEDLSEVHMRLINVVVENLDWRNIIERYDRAATLFYLDPPYHKMPFYKHNMESSDFARMAEVLKSVKGKFLLSLNDNDFICDTFAQFKQKKVSVKYSVGKDTKKIGKELLISNY